MKNPLKRWDVFLALVFFLVAIPAESNEIFTLLEDQTLSYRHIFRMSLGDPEVTQFSDEIVLVSLDEELYEEYGSYPFRRTDLGAIIETRYQSPVVAATSRLQLSTWSQQWTIGN